MGILLTPLILLLTLSLLLYVPSVQQWAVRNAVRELSKSTGMDVSVGLLRLDFPVRLRLEKVLMIKPNRDTLLAAHMLRVQVDPLPLLKKRARVPHLDLQDAQVHLPDSTGQNQMRIAIRKVRARNLFANLENQTADLGQWDLEGVNFYMDNHRPPKEEDDEPSEPLYWKIRMDRLGVKDTRCHINLQDSLLIKAHLEQAEFTRPSVDLSTILVTVAHAKIKGAHASYASDMNPAQGRRMDYGHIAVNPFMLEAKNIRSELIKLDVEILDFQAVERSGLSIRSMQGRYQMDSLGMQINDFRLSTRESAVMAKRVELPWGIFKSDGTAFVYADVEGHVSIEDLRKTTPLHIEKMIEKDVYSQLPAIELSARLAGTVHEMNINRLMIHWPSVIDVEVKGRASHLTEDKRRRGNFSLQADFHPYATSLLSVAGADVAKRFALPSGSSIRGNVKLQKELYDARLLVTDPGGAPLHLNGSYGTRSRRYQAMLRADGFDLRRFMPADSVGMLSLHAEVDGRGLDILNEHNHANLKLRLGTVKYKSQWIDSLTIDGNLNKGALFLALNSASPNAALTAQVDALLNHKRIDGTVNLDVQHLDLNALGLSTVPFDLHTRMQAEIRSDLKSNHFIDADISHTQVNFNGEQLAPEMIALRGYSDTDSTQLALLSGDLRLNFDAANGYEDLIAMSAQLGKTIAQEIGYVTGTKGRNGNLDSLIAMLPRAELALQVGRNNAFWPYLRHKRISFDYIDTHLETSPQLGINGNVHVRDFALDTVRISLGELGIQTHRKLPDSSMLHLNLALDRRKHLHQNALHLRAQVEAYLHHALVRTALLDDKLQPMHRFGVHAGWDERHYRLTLLPSPDIMIGYTPFTANRDNSLSYGKADHLLHGNLQMQGERDALISLQSDSLTSNEVRLQIRKLTLGRFARWEMMPPVDGTVFADINVVQPHGDIKQPVITADLSVNDLIYDQKHLGNIGSALFYEPRNDHSHYITAEISHNSRPALAVNGIYRPDVRDNALEGSVRLDSLPLKIADPFLGKELAGLEGTANGHLNLGGTLKDIRLDGALAFADGLVDLRQYGARLRLDTIPITISDSKLNFNHFAIRPDSHPDQAVFLDGYFAFLGKEAMNTNLRLRAGEVEITNSKRTADSQQLFGRIITNADLRMTGRANRPRIRGSLGILGGTHVTYVMQNMQIKASEKMSDVVKFTDFRDTLFVPQPIRQTELGGLDISVNLHIDPAVKVNVDMGDANSNYLSVTGGGDLNFTYPPYGEMSLTGTYSLNDGYLRYYVAPVIGSKEFTIDPQSYIQFNGKPDNPYLSFTAINNMKANVGDGTKGASRRVDFMVSIKAQDYLDKLKILFDVDAPGDLATRNILSSMNQEERGKQAIVLMATGTFLANQGLGNTNYFNNMLSGLLQSQVNNLFGKVLQGTSLNLGMELHDGQNGTGAYTNYTYSFSRSFYNDRIKAIIGGKVQSGQVPGNREQTFIDNAALEYRVDRAGSQYLKIFHKRTFDNLIEGETAETGFSYIVRRKLENLSDLFRFPFKRQSAQVVPTVTDSITAVPTLTRTE